MKSTGGVVWLFLILSLFVLTRSQNACDTFYLLNLYPAPDESNSTGFDRGLELIPAGHLATQHINSDPSILQGHKIELIDVPTEACEQTLIIEGLTNYYEQVLNPDGVCIYGIVGLYCSTVTNVIAPIASHPNTGYVQLAASTSPMHRNVTRFPYTFHTISSTRVLNRAVVQLMEEFKWNRVVSIFNSLSIYHRSTAINFEGLLSNLTKATLTSIALVPSFQTSTIFDIFVDQETRIGYISATDKEIAAFFCEAHKRQFLWPNYAYIIVENSIPGVLNHQTDCSAKDLSNALEGTFLLRYRLRNYPGEYVNVSGRLYEEYYDEYIEELKRLAEKMNVTLQSNSYADTLYDQVWAFALALNMSLDIFDILNSSLSQGRLNNGVLVRKTLAEHMKGINFTGASGSIRFGAENEAFTPVEVYQIQNTTQVLVGTYDSFTETIDFRRNFNKKIVPKDTFPVYFSQAPEWVGVLVIIANFAILVLTLFNTAVTIILRKKPEIKSGSYSLNLAILLGCSVLSISPIFATVLAVFVDSESQGFTYFCNLELWTFIVGNVLILSTLLMRQLRIFNIFRPYNFVGKYWSDKYLILYTALVCSIFIALLILWAVADLFKHTTTRQYISAPPHYLVINSCTSENLGIWLAVIFSLVLCIMILLVFFAIQTRHVRLKNFKDTKKVNMFIFSVCIVYAIFIPLWVILTQLGFFITAYACRCIAILSGAFLCQLFLLLPKTIPALSNCLKPHFKLKDKPKLSCFF